MKPAEPKSPTASDRVVGILFLALIPFVTLVPYGPVPVWLTQDLVLRWASAAAFLVFLALSLFRGRDRTVLHLDFPNLLFLLLVGWSLLSAENSKEPFDSFYGFKGFLSLALWWFSLRFLWDRWPGLYAAFERVFWWTALAAGTWVIFTTTLHHYQVGAFADIVPQKGPFPNQNIAAGFLGMALLWGLNRRPQKDPLHWTALGWVLLAWGMTESRGALVALGLTVILYLLLNMHQVEDYLHRWKSGQWMKAGFALLFVFIVICWKNGMVSRLFNPSESDPRAYFRLDVWISSLHMIQAQPLFGFGPATFADVYPSFRPLAFWNTYNPFAHNEFLQVAAECGLPALLLVALLLWALLRAFWPVVFMPLAARISNKTGPLRPGPGPRLIAVLRKARTPSPPLGPAELAFYLVLFETVHNSVDFTFHEWSHRLVLAGFVTYALRGKKTEDDLKAQFQFSRPAFTAGWVLLALFVLAVLGLGGGRDYLARLYDHLSVGRQNSGDLPGAEAYARKSLDLNPVNWDPWNTLGAIEDARAASEPDPAVREKHFNLADGYFQKAIQCSSYAYEPRENRIQSMVKRGRLSEALDLQNQLISQGPQLPSNETDLAGILLKMGRPKEALAPAQKLIDLYPYYLPGYFLKARALETLGRRSEALRVFEDAREMLKTLNVADPSGQVEPNIKRLQGP